MAVITTCMLLLNSSVTQSKPKEVNRDHVLDFNIYQEMTNNVDKKLVPQVKEMKKIYL